MGALGWDIATAGPYSVSAHGNDTYGVNRSSMSIEEGHGYAQGNCAHCHEQHASVGGAEPDPASGTPDKYALFGTLWASQQDGFCVKCHKAPGTSKQVTMPNQYSYSYKFGGDTALTCPGNIRAAFRFIDNSGMPQSQCSSTTGSAHYLSDIRAFLKGKWGFSNTVGNVNPCSGCHNPHKVQRHNYPVGSKGTSPLSLPSTHNGDWNVYGAETTERMSSYTYQAPYRYGSTNTYEPNGDGTSNGSNMPDYVTFCMDCHNTIYDTQMNSAQRNTFTNNFLGLYIRNPDWNTSPHGYADGAKPDSMKRKAPYTADKNYVLSCTDCHEAHGSPNGLLMRKEVNGSSTVAFTAWADRASWLSLCQRCHTIGSGHQSGKPCNMCHSHYPNALEPF